MADPIEFTPASGLSASPATSNSKTCTAGSALLVVFFCDEWNTAPIPTCAVTGATPELIVSHRIDISSPRTTAWVVPNIPGGTTEAVVSDFTGTRNWQLIVAELPGFATASPIDAFNSHDETSSSQRFYGGPSGGISIAAGSTAFSIASIGNDPGTLTPDTGWAALTGLGTGTGNYLKVAWKAFPSGGTAERGLQQGAANDRIYVGLIASIKAAGGSTVFDITQTAAVAVATTVSISGDPAFTVPFDLTQTAAVSVGTAVSISGDLAFSSTNLALTQTSPVAVGVSVGFSGDMAYSSAPVTFDIAPPIEMAVATTVSVSGEFAMLTPFSLVQTAAIGVGTSVAISGNLAFSDIPPNEATGVGGLMVGLRIGL